MGAGFCFAGERVVDLGGVLAGGGDDDEVEVGEVRVDEAARGGEELVVAGGVGGGGGLGSGGRIVDAGEAGAVDRHVVEAVLLDEVVMVEVGVADTIAGKAVPERRAGGDTCGEVGENFERGFDGLFDVGLDVIVEAGGCAETEALDGLMHLLDVVDGSAGDAEDVERVVAGHLAEHEGDSLQLFEPWGRSDRPRRGRG